MGIVLIYQIGRLDTDAFQDQRFRIEHKEIEAPLSSFAIRKAIESCGKEGHVFLFYPVSLPFNKLLLERKNFINTAPPDLIQLLKEILKKPEWYLQRPEEFFCSHPHANAATGYRIIHSIGSFATDNPDQPVMSFDRCYYSDIVFEILLKVIKGFLNRSGIERVIFDISSGHNIYVSALIEAARYFSVWLSMRYLAEPHRAPHIDIAFCDPIMGSRQAYKIYFEKMAVKAFFDAPIGADDIGQYSLSRSIFPLKEQRSDKRLLHELLEAFLLVYSCIKNNTPLYVYHAGYHEISCIEDFSGKLFDHISKILFKSYEESPGLNKEKYLKAILSLSFYFGLSRLLSIRGITKYDPSNGVDVRALEEAFASVYNYKSVGLNLNEAILRHEVDMLCAHQAGISDKWMEVLSLISRPPVKHGSPDKRNFFAHAGFESHVTECRRVGDKVFLRYKEDHISTIRKWLINSA